MRYRNQQQRVELVRFYSYTNIMSNNNQLIVLKLGSLLSLKALFEVVTRALILIQTELLSFKAFTLLLIVGHSLHTGPRTSFILALPVLVRPIWIQQAPNKDDLLRNP